MKTFSDEEMRNYIQRAKAYAKSRMEAIENLDENDERKAVLMEYNEIYRDIISRMEEALGSMDCAELNSRMFMPDRDEDIIKYGVAVRVKGLSGVTIKVGECDFSASPEDRECTINRIKSLIVIYLKDFAYHTKCQSGLYPVTPFVKYDISVKKYDSGFSVYLHYETPQLKLL